MARTIEKINIENKQSLGITNSTAPQESITTLKLNINTR
jgi:hypothetical protein